MSNSYEDYLTKINAQISEIKNALIAGDNLIVMNDLLPYFNNKIKLIYIDPPYNTKRKFIYNDNFGTHHDWLKMMRPRLLLAHEFLADDGFIFISIDDNEVHYLRLLLDDIFGIENFRNCIVVPRGIKNVQAQFKETKSLAIGHEYILFYSKNKETKIKKYEVEGRNVKFVSGTWNNHWRGTDRPNLRYELFGICPQQGQWRWSKERSLKAIENYKYVLKDLNINKNDDLSLKNLNEWYKKNIKVNDKFDLLRLNKHGKPEHYIPPKKYILGNDLWADIKLSGTNELKKIIPHIHFDMPKSVELIKRIIDLVTTPNSHDYIFDFFAGSGTTAQAVMEKNREDGGNRQFLLIQLAELVSTAQSEQHKINTIADLAYYRLKKFIIKNNLSVEMNYFVQSNPNEINSSSPAPAAGLAAGLAAPSSNPPIIKDI